MINARLLLGVGCVSWKKRHSVAIESHKLLQFLLSYFKSYMDPVVKISSINNVYYVLEL